jgi:uncharacterized protein YabE (DUF348 family)/3D (Asp-Asp-Asp) domain-containing protein
VHNAQIRNFLKFDNEHFYSYHGTHKPVEQLVSYQKRVIKIMLKPIKMIAALSAALVISGTAMTGTVFATTHNAVVTVNGKSTTLRMLQNGETQSILQMAGVELAPMDRVDRETNTNGDILLNVTTGRAVSVQDGNKFSSLVVNDGTTVEEVLNQLGADPIGEPDTVTPGLQEKVQDNMQITVERRQHVSVSVDGETKDILVLKNETAVQALREAGIDLGKDDELNLPFNKPLEENAQVVVNRITYQETTETRTLDFKTSEQEDASLAKGTRQVQTAGQKGEASVVVRTKYVNGKQDSQQELSSTVTKQPVNQVVLVGTKVQVPQPTQNTSYSGTSGGNTIAGLSYSRVISGVCTAYTNDGICSTGVPTMVGRVAVNPAVIPYGTRMYITSADGSYVYGYAVAADTGGFVSNGSGVMIDLYMNTMGECTSFGRRSMNIYFLN